jgi:hypothetical protein
VALSLEINLSGREADLSPLSRTEVKREAISPGVFMDGGIWRSWFQFIVHYYSVIFVVPIVIIVSNTMPLFFNSALDGGE